MSSALKPIALVTGASSGLGESFARQLAAMGYDLVLVARREANLIRLAEDLHGEDQVTVRSVPADLSTEGGIQKVVAVIDKLPRIDLLVNNAGFGSRGEFSKKPVEDALVMLSVHCTAVVRLSHAALQKMIPDGTGGIINVSSISAFAPLAGSALYSASKAFLVNFSKALQVECRPFGIQVQALCPGFFHSEFHDVMQANKRSMPGFVFQTSDQVARSSLSALRHNRVVVIPGFFYGLAAWIVRMPGVGDGLLQLFTRIAGKWRRSFLREG